MKKVFSGLIIILIVIVIASSCKKSGTPSHAITADTISHWTINGKTDTGATTVYAGTYLESNDYISDTVTDLVVIDFSTKPTVNRKFRIVGISTTPNSTECGIGVATEISSNLIENAVSIDTPGDSLTVTIINGKIKATFSNIPMLNKQSSIYTAISGQIIEQ
jgi:hypothetical protein